MTTRLGLLCHPGFGGSVRVALGLAEQLGRRGHAVHLFSRAAPLGLRTFPVGVTFHGASEAPRASAQLDVGWSEEALAGFTDLVLRVSSEAGLDVLHFHYALPFAHVAAQVRRRAGGRRPRLIGTLHGTDVRPDGAGKAVKHSLRAADVLTTVSSSHARLSRNVFGLAVPPVVIPNFIDVHGFRPRPDTPAPGRRPRVVHVSNFRPVKNVEAVARIFAEVRRAVDADLWLVGDGEAMPAVRALLDGAGLLDDTRFYGLRRDVDRILPLADVLLVTSRLESFCLVALEAQACGVPVVAPRVGGLSEVVRDGVTGLLYPDGDEATAARHVQRLLRSPDLRAHIGAAGIERARLFAATRIVPRYERLYANLVGARQRAPAVGAHA